MCSFPYGTLTYRLSGAVEALEPYTVDPGVFVIGADGSVRREGIPERSLTDASNTILHPLDRSASVVEAANAGPFLLCVLMRWRARGLFRLAVPIHTHHGMPTPSLPTTLPPFPLAGISRRALAASVLQTLRESFLPIPGAGRGKVNPFVGR